MRPDCFAVGQSICHALFADTTLVAIHRLCMSVGHRIEEVGFLVRLLIRLVCFHPSLHSHLALESCFHIWHLHWRANQSRLADDLHFVVAAHLDLLAVSQVGVALQSRLFFLIDGYA